ncbi:MAG: hypothetical protein EP343_12165 [Deltaproteobacteria bacterium]|nr:MAG: hypothetical protein EP343_12165 [Deltaproteobacteria bacterium]
MKSKLLVSVLVVVSILVIVLGGILGYIVSSKPYVTPLPKSMRLPLTFPRPLGPTNVALTAFINSKKLETMGDAAYKWGQILEPHGWFRHVGEAEKESKKHESLRRTFRSLLDKGGCLRRMDPKDPNGLRYLHMIYMAKIVQYTALLQAQTGKPDAAAKELHWLQQHMMRQIQRCDKPLIMLMVWIAGSKLLLAAQRKVATHPKLSEALLLQVMKSLDRWAHRFVSPVPDTLRSELGLIRFSLANPWRGFNRPTFAVWPWWDSSNTRELVFAQFRSFLYRVSLPYGRKAWTRTSVDRQIDEIIRVREDANNLLRLRFYNWFGFAIFIKGFRGVMKYNWKWHQQRCFLAASQAWMYDVYKARFQRKPSGVSRSINPLTKKPFGTFASSSNECDLDDPIKKSNLFQGERTHVNKWLPSHATAAKVRKRRKKKSLRRSAKKKKKARNAKTKVQPKAKSK